MSEACILNDKGGTASPTPASVKASDDFLDPVFEAFFERFELPEGSGDAEQAGAGHRRMSAKMPQPRWSRW